MREISSLTVAYIGRGYHGFQKQPNYETIEGCVFSALKESSCFDDFSKRTYSHGGRTDSGVNAIGQIISLSLPERCTPEKAAEAINDRCRGVYVWGCRGDLPPQFRARFWALWREYLYIDERWRYLSSFDGLRRALSWISSLRSLAPFYRNFKLERFNKNYFERRILSSSMVELDGYILLKIKGESFPYHFVRRVVSFLRRYKEELSPEQNLEMWPGGEAEAEKLILLRIGTPYHHRELKSLKEVSVRVISSLPLTFSSVSQQRLLNYILQSWDP